MAKDDYRAGGLSYRLGLEVRERREQRHMSQQELAKAMAHMGHKWHQTTVNRIEAGTRTVSYDEACGLAMVLGFMLDQVAATDLHHALVGLAQAIQALTDQKAVVEVMENRFARAWGQFFLLVDLQKKLGQWPPKLTPEDAVVMADVEAAIRKDAALRDAVDAVIAEEERDDNGRQQDR